MSFLEQNAMETLIRRQVDQLFAQQYSAKTQARARITLSANAALPGGAWTLIPCDTEDYDTDNMYDPLIRGRLTCRTPGTYLCFAGIGMPAGSGGNILYPGIRKNGTVISQGPLATILAAFAQTAIAMSVEPMAINDYVEIVADPNIAYSVAGGTFFHATRIQ